MINAHQELEEYVFYIEPNQEGRDMTFVVKRGEL